MYENFAVKIRIISGGKSVKFILIELVRRSYLGIVLGWCRQ